MFVGPGWPEWHSPCWAPWRVGRKDDEILKTQYGYHGHDPRTVNIGK